MCICGAQWFAEAKTSQIKIHFILLYQKVSTEDPLLVQFLLVQISNKVRILKIQKNSLPLIFMKKKTFVFLNFRFMSFISLKLH